MPCQNKPPCESEPLAAKRRAAPGDAGMGERRLCRKSCWRLQLLPKRTGDAKNRDRLIKHFIFRRKRKASSASSCLQGFGVMQRGQGLLCGSAGACWGWHVLHEQPGGSRGEGGGSRGGEKEKEIVPCPSLLPKNEKKL